MCYLVVWCLRPTLSLQFGHFLHQSIMALLQLSLLLLHVLHVVRQGLDLCLVLLEGRTMNPDLWLTCN